MGFHPPLWVHTNGYLSQIVAITTSSTVALAEPKSKAKGPRKSKTKIDKSKISAPEQGQFVNIAHMGYNAEKGFTSTGVDSSWLTLITQLRDLGVDESILQDRDNQRFMRDFVQTYQSESTSSSSTTNGTKAVAAKKKALPPAPQAKGSKQLPPPPS